MCLKFHSTHIDPRTHYYLQKEAEAYWEKRVELVGQMAAYAERRKELMAPVVHQVFEVIDESEALLSCAKKEKEFNPFHQILFTTLKDGQLTLEELMKGQEKKQKLSKAEAA